ncbi:MAG TPA: NapC/NirT family cytochrome c [Thermoanaerobaculia bacterium]|nr:NapC/NirT family cytochrome c [Thermoanaerobaculia bacterium]
MKSFFISLTRNPISLIGSAIVTASAILIVTLFTLGLLGFEGGPYIGILAYLILPGIFILGLLLIPIGIARQRRRDRAAEARGEAPAAFPILNFNDPVVRRRALAFTALTAINVVILSVATYEGVHTMETTQFCGQACHSVMQPEYTAFQRSPHANVRCVDCHIGPGADWFVKSKLSGSWQVISVNLNLYPRPIPAPVHNLRPARETCQQCHWPAKFVGDRLKVIDSYSEDEANTHLQTVLLMKVGGRHGNGSQGIHWHVDPGVRIRYLADEKRETIYEVEMKAADGKVTRFAMADKKAPAGAAWRIMDCMDCHNRPSHTFRAPDQEVDAALLAGRIPAGLPFVRREAVALLKGKYASHEAAEKAFNDGLLAFYRKDYPQIAASRAKVIETTAAVMGDIYSANVFPSMNIDWGTYPNHIGHERSPGCFRCHDDQHVAADGRAISQDCSTCHGLLAMQEENPEILKSLEQ